MGTYNLDHGAEKRSKRNASGKLGASSYPFSSTDRRWINQQQVNETE